MTPLAVLLALAPALAGSEPACPSADLGGDLPLNARVLARVTPAQAMQVQVAGTASLRDDRGSLLPARVDPFPTVGPDALLLYTPRAGIDPVATYTPGWQPPDAQRWRPLDRAVPFRRALPPEVDPPEWSGVELVVTPGPAVTAKLSGVADASPLTLEVWIETVGQDDVRSWGRWVLGRVAGEVEVALAGGPCAPPFPRGFPTGADVRATLVLVDVVGIGSMIRTARFVVP